MDVERWLDRFLARETAAAEATGQQSADYVLGEGITSSLIDRMEDQLEIRYPTTLRHVAQRVRASACDAEFAFARMGELWLMPSWRARLERIHADIAVVEAVFERRLLPIGDDYGGRYWICLDYEPAAPEPSLIELNLDALPEDIAGDLNAHIENLGPTFCEGVDTLHRRVFEELGRNLP